MDEKSLIQSLGLSSDVIYDIAVRVLRPEERSILDLGCGQGQLLKRLRDAGAQDLTGCDGYHYPELDTQGIRFVQADLQKEFPFADNSFSAVSAIEVIEHLENPWHFVREIFRVLKPGGLALVSTPNNECITSTLSLITRGYFSAFADSCYPAHITPVLRNDLDRMFRKAGAKNPQVIWSDSGRIPRLDQRWQSISKSLFRGKFFSDNYLLQGRKPHAS